MASFIIVQNQGTSVGSIYLGDGANGIPIKMAYLGDILVFSGQR